jgi:hypothetical protein
MAKNAMPVSKAKTAYGLLSEIRKLILEEPRRYDQGAWLLNDEDSFSFKYGSDALAAVPACGTIGCVAGWVVALQRRTPHDFMIATEAADILGLTSEQRTSLFRPNASGDREKIGPERHAQRGAAHIARFQHKHAAQLRAKRI